MINLLPPDYKQDVSYARRNTRLLKWCVAFSCVIAGMILFLFAGQLYISNTANQYSKQIAQTKEELKAQKLEETQATVESISSNIKLIVQVLSRQIIFSELIKQIGAVMPAQSVLSSIDLSKVEGGIDLTAKAQNYETATQIQVNLQDPENKLFEEADIISLDCKSADGPYPCTINLRALFAKENSFTFLNQQKNARSQP